MFMVGEKGKQETNVKQVALPATCIMLFVACLIL
jgi:hypothetical protein